MNRSFRPSCLPLLALLAAAASCRREPPPADPDDVHAQPNGPDPAADAAPADGGSDPVADDAANAAPVGPPAIPPACGDGSAAGFGACVDRERYETNLRLVSGFRPPGSPHWQASQDLCAERFETLGYEVERHAYGTGVNVIGVKPGADSAERVVVSAHYDHIEGCEGADDDASGIAGVLETARVLASGRFARTLVVACWDEEEFGMIGSAAWVARTKERGETVVASFVYEMIGFASSEPGSQTFPPGIELVFRRQLAWLEARESRGDFIGLLANGSAATAVARLEAHAATFELPAMSLALPDAMTDLPFLSDFRRSDHAPFWAAGWPAVMLGDTADFRYPQYHCVAGPDVPELLDMEFATRVVRTVTAAAADLLGPLTP